MSRSKTLYQLQQFDSELDKSLNRILEIEQLINDRQELNRTIMVQADAERILHEKLGVPKTKTVWKRPIGKEVAKRMPEDDIPKQIKDFIVKVAN